MRENREELDLAPDSKGTRPRSSAEPEGDRDSRRNAGILVAQLQVRGSRDTVANRSQARGMAE